MRGVDFLLSIIDMKPFLFLALFFVTSLGSYSQSGCTDSTANNYNPSAVSNDGSCTYNASSQIFHLKGPLASFANESSGIVFTDGVIWTHNDSGNPSKIYKADTTNGALLQTLSVTNFPNTDWEDITADSAYLYIADCGNNNGTRTDLKVLKIDKTQYLSNPAAVVNVTAQAINFSYSDQTNFTSNNNNNYDCEAIISIGNFLYLFTKDGGDFQTRVYKLSKTPGTYTLSPYTSYNVNGKITGAAYNKQTHEVALIGYLSQHKNSFLWFLNDFSGDMFFSGNKRRVELGNSVNDWQTEGIDYISNSELFFSCETSYVPASLYSAVKNNTIPLYTDVPELQNQLTQIKIYPNPTENTLYLDLINNGAKKITVSDLLGKTVLTTDCLENKLSLDVSKLPSGVYFIAVTNSAETYKIEKFIKL